MLIIMRAELREQWSSVHEKPKEINLLTDITGVKLTIKKALANLLLQDDSGIFESIEKLRVLRIDVVGESHVVMFVCHAYIIA